MVLERRAGRRAQCAGCSVQNAVRRGTAMAVEATCSQLGRILGYDTTRYDTIPIISNQPASSRQRPWGRANCSPTTLRFAVYLKQRQPHAWPAPTPPSPPPTYLCHYLLDHHHHLDLFMLHPHHSHPHSPLPFLRSQQALSLHFFFFYFIVFHT